jgi:hypothetical protein
VAGVYATTSAGGRSKASGPMCGVRRSRVQGFVRSRVVLSTAGTHTLGMLSLSVLALRCQALWGRRRFMTGCAVSGSMLRCRQVVLISMVTRAGAVLMSKCLVLRPWWWGRQVPERGA